MNVNEKASLKLFEFEFVPRITAKFITWQIIDSIGALY